MKSLKYGTFEDIFNILSFFLSFSEKDVSDLLCPLFLAQNCSQSVIGVAMKATKRQTELKLSQWADSAQNNGKQVMLECMASQLLCHLEYRNVFE